MISYDMISFAANLHFKLSFCNCKFTYDDGLSNNPVMSNIDKLIRSENTASLSVRFDKLIRSENTASRSVWFDKLIRSENTASRSVRFVQIVKALFGPYACHYGDLEYFHVLSGRGAYTV